jgi:hypothetical protein
MPKATKPSKKRTTSKELTKKAMKTVKGGTSLMQACATGKHIPTVVIVS